ncbi:ATP-dependent helicase HrpB [Pontibacterium sp.]|uniref:ATP-dependent helicase HrpB n=1 Tax=Pontibacterium sp. TaxID=2036026 RepID=UPI003567B05B
MSDLPINTVLPELKSLLCEHHQLVLEAPPGAGKTTGVPLALLDEVWLSGQKIIMLEPRRLAARAAAERMASLLGEKAGETVGYRVRLDTKVSRKTRIEVVTEGILTRMLQSDPSLEGIGLVIFDEFHERSLDADLALALTLQGRMLFRDDDPLKLLVMSATLDGAAVAELLDDAPILRSEGRAYPVTVHYGDAAGLLDRAIEPVAAATVMDALISDEGSVLVFLPGQREINRTYKLLTEKLTSRADLSHVIVTPLYGDLTLQEQRKAIEPSPAGQRKVVLATAIAETSLTIEGVRVVVDAGLSREAIFDPATGMSRLQTRRLSRAASVQRAGRAGRMEPGVCYRLWSETQQAQLAPFTAPEITQADLTPLVLQLIRWGVDDPAELSWLDLPPPALYQQALDLLLRLDAVEVSSDSYRLTAHGERMAQLPTHPRLAHMLLLGIRYGLTEQACHLAALLSDRDPLKRRDTDIAERLAWLRGDLKAERHTQGALHRMRQVSKQFKRQCGLLESEVDNAVSDPANSRWTGFLIAGAYPDRIACQRSKGGADYRMSNGRAARLPEGDHHNAEWLALAQVGGRSGDHTDRIFLSAVLEPDLFDGPLADMVSSFEEVTWSKQQDRLTAELQRRVGKLVLSRAPLKDISDEAKSAALLGVVRKRGLNILPWTPALRSWQTRVQFLHSSFAEVNGGASTENHWPDLSDKHLLDSVDQWLAPYLSGISHINHFANLDLRNILLALLPWPLPQQLDELAPERFTVPTGSNIKIDYSETPPVLAVRMQEMFGCLDTPRIGNATPLKLHLLSPAMRPLQVTQDLAGFWQNSYPEVQKEMKGRYPKHRWPDDPANAEPSRRSIKPKK